MIDVMIIDDDAPVRERLKAMIAWDELGLRLVCEAADSDTARELYLLFRPKIVITDIFIPIISGLELAEELTRMDAHIRFIIITGYNDFESLQKAVRIGAIDLLAKPIFPADINTSLRRAIDDFSREREQFAELISSVRMDGNYEVLRRFLTHALLSGRYRDVEQINRRANELGMIPMDGNYTVVVIEPASPDILEQQSINENAIMHTIEDEFQKNGIHLYCYGEDLGKIDCLIHTEEESPDNVIEDMFYQFQEHLRFVGDCEFYIGIGQTTNDVLCIPTSRMEAQIALNYQRVLSGDCIIHYKNIKRFEVPSPAGVSLEEYLMTLFCNNNLDELIVTVENYVYTLSTQSVDGLKLVSNFCLNYLTYIIKTGVTLGLTFDRIEELDISIRKLNTLADPMQRLQYILDATRQLLTLLFGAPDSGSNYLIARAKVYISDNLGDVNLNLDMVANYVGLSRIYFCKLFHKEEGVSFTNYLKNERIERAKKLLISTNMKVFEVSIAAGFSSGKYFGFVFKREVGMTPLEYRKVAFGPHVTETNGDLC